MTQQGLDEQELKTASDPTLMAIEPRQRFCHPEFPTCTAERCRPIRRFRADRKSRWLATSVRRGKRSSSLPACEAADFRVSLEAARVGNGSPISDPIGLAKTEL